MSLIFAAIPEETSAGLGIVLVILGINSKDLDDLAARLHDMDREEGLKWLVRIKD